MSAYEDDNGEKGAQSPYYVMSEYDYVDGGVDDLVPDISETAFNLAEAIISQIQKRKLSESKRG